MRWLRSLTLALALVVAWGLPAAGPAAAESVLRIGLNDDPDALDPTISRAYVGRLVFAGLCDKLFDVTPELKIVPQLATGYEWAPDQRSVVIKLRGGVRHLRYFFAEFEDLLVGAVLGHLVLDRAAGLLRLLVRLEIVDLEVNTQLFVFRLIELRADSRPHLHR